MPAAIIRFLKGSVMPRCSCLLLIVAVLACEGCARKPKYTTPIMPGGKMMMATPGLASPVVTPSVKRAEEVDLPDELPVVGVVVGGKSRAYTIAALSPMNRHVVNDLIDGVPVSVTYCDVAKCLRVYTDAKRGKPLEIQQTGRTNEGLLLRYEGRIFVQVPGSVPGGSGEKAPLEELNAEETTWKAWRQKHPGTEIYTGAEADPSGPPSKKT
jgi:hypothetical protein